MWLFLLLILSIVFIIVTTSILKWHPFLSLLAAALGFGIFSGTMSLNEVVISINTGFGNTIGFIGIVILAGSIIGKFLEMSGGANRLAAGTLKVVGKNNVPLAMSILGWIVSIPVFCDSAFIILLPLARALSRQIKATLAIAAMALSLGLILTHSIIPPTPGPVGAAAILDADLGLTILFGIPVSLVGLAGAWFFAVKIASRCEIDPGPEETVTSSPEYMPSLFKSILPVFLPIFLIILRSVSELPSRPFGEGIIYTGANFIGQPVIALLIGVLLAFLLPEKLTASMVSSSGWVGQAIIGAAGIIIITASGGAFGKVLQDSGISEIIKNNVVEVKSLSIFLPVLIAAALKIAQGSGTVAIITTASLMAPLIGTLGMDSAPSRALLVVAIGAGSTIASHANDSYFWVVTQMSGMTVNQGYKLQTRGTFFVGVCSSLAAWILSLFIL